MCLKRGLIALALLISAIAIGCTCYTLRYERAATGRVGELMDARVRGGASDGIFKDYEGLGRPTEWKLDGVDSEFFTIPMVVWIHFTRSGKRVSAYFVFQTLPPDGYLEYREFP